MDNFSGTDLFEMKATLEKQFEQDYIRSPGSKAKRFDFLIGEWDLTRKSFDSQGEVARETRGIVVARYTFEGRVIQEDFHNYLANGEAYRGGTALYTFNPSTEVWGVAAVDASTGATSYSPEWIGDEVRYGSVVNLPGRDVYTRSRIFNISVNSYEWEQEVSLDGETWHKNYHILNTRNSE